MSSPIKDAAILFVDDDETLVQFVAPQLRAEGATVHTSGSVAGAMAIARRVELDLALLDLQLPDGTGIDVLAQLRTMSPELPIVMFTAYADVRSAVEAMKLGAVDYLQKPFSRDDLALALERAMTLDALRREIRQLQRLETSGKGAIVYGESHAMRAIWHMVETVAPTDANVLITGENGTGKEIVARAIHAASRRQEGPFIPVNCGGMTETLVEDQLFGHEAHAFTDARSQRRGDFELANKGTIFLDEIGEMPIMLQPTLLRVLDQRRFFRIGGEREIHTDVRVIAATNRDLDEAMRQGAFRQDLLFRLKVFTIAMPPLRDRREDIPLLTAVFLRDIGQSLGKPKRRVTPETLHLLSTYDWPGNLRQLRNVVEHALIVCQGPEILPGHLPTELGGGQQPSFGPHSDHLWERWLNATPGAIASIDEFEERIDRLLVERALRQSPTKTGAAHLLGVTPANLAYRIKKHGLREPPDSTSSDRN